MLRARMTRLFAVLVLFPALLSACATATATSDPLDPPGFTPTKAPADWGTVGVDAHYVAIPPVALSAVPALRLALPDGVSPNQALALSDGGCLLVTTVALDKKDPAGNPQSVLRALRFQADGKVRWDRTYGQDPFSGYVSTACVFPDDGFAVSLTAARAGSSQGEQVSLLRRFSPDGTLLWKTAEGQVDIDAFQFLLPLSDGALLSAGTVTPKLPDGTYSHDSDLSLLRIESDGRFTKDVTIGSGEFDSLMDATYADPIGLVLSWRSDSGRMDSQQGTAFPMDSHLSCYDAQLVRTWKTDLSEKAQLYELLLQDGTGGIFGFGQSVESATTGSGSKAQSALFRFDGQGSLKWTFVATAANTWYRSALALADGTAVLGGFRPTAAGGQEAFLELLSADGKLLRELDVLPGTMDWLHATKDGGFTACTRQTVGALPQPPYISSMWQDSEAVVSHYDAGLHLVWRRTIDQYKHDTRGDVIVPTSEDKLLVG